MKPVKSTLPNLQFRPAQPYAAIRLQAPVPFGDQLQPLWGEVAAWLASQGQEPVGAPFIRYLSMGNESGMELEVGFPVASELTASDRVTTGIFPAGTYAVLLYTGPYDHPGLRAATASLLEWAAAHQIAWDTYMDGDLEYWTARSEIYLTDPAKEPDPNKWLTELVFLTRS